MNDQYGTTGHRPVFRLSPSEPDLGQLILQARDEVVCDANLSLGSRLMFVIILDRSVRSSSNIKPGVVTISQTKLSEILNVGRRTVWNWKDELVRRAVIWMSSQPMPNAWPIDTYHVSLIHPPSSKGEKTTVEGAWGNGLRRARPENASFAVRRNLVPVERSFQTPEKSSFLPNNAAPSGNEVPLSVATSFHSPSQSGATGSRNLVPLAVESTFHSPSQSGATGSRNVVPLGVAPDCLHKKAKVGGSSLSEAGGSLPPPDLVVQEAIKDGDGAFADWRETWTLKSPSNPKGEYRGKIAKELGRCRMKQQTQPSAFWKRRAEHLQTVLDGGKPPVAKPGPARSDKPAKPAPKAIPFPERSKLFAKAKAEAGL